MFLTSEDKQRYYASREWAEKKSLVRARSGGTCERCRMAPMENTHHLTYARFGREMLEDLQGVCVPCHEFISNKSSVDPRNADSSGQGIATTKFVTGIAGSGKTEREKRRSEGDPKSMQLTATTGVAAVHAGVTTWWTALGLRPDTIDDRFVNGRMFDFMDELSEDHRLLAIDECSMLDGRHLDMLVKTADRIIAERDRDFGVELIGDFCQLGTIKGPGNPGARYCFEADCWPRFDKNTEKVAGNWRHSEENFINALSLLRRGDGRAAVDLIKNNVTWKSCVDMRFQGTVMFATNDECDRFNERRFIEIDEKVQTFNSRRSGKQAAEWRRHVPESLDLKIGAYVMVLVNDTEKDPLCPTCEANNEYDEDRYKEDSSYRAMLRQRRAVWTCARCGNRWRPRSKFRWVNGDCGTVVEFFENQVRVRLARNDQEHWIEYAKNEFVTKSEYLKEFDRKQCDDARRTGRELPDVSVWLRERSAWLRGSVEFMPLRLAYASTVYKSQGLTLTGPIQICIRHQFFSKEGMVYVALSRASRSDNLVIVGDADMLVRRTKVNPMVRRWL